ncbi:MAG: PilZ domain-containing protein [Eubacteriales bacterium]|nr:PilZ domain-containing protein [Eubacteriales bacterium]
MAGELKIRKGAKIQIAFDRGAGESPSFDMASSFFKALDESFFLISVPMKGGKQVTLDETQKLLMRYQSNGEDLILAGYADDSVKEGIRTYWKIRRVTEQRTFFKRADERLKAAIKVNYTMDNWPLNDDGTVDMEDGLTLDISAGGAAVFMNTRVEVGEIMMMTLPKIGTVDDGNKIEDVVSVICWQREAPKGGLYKFLCGVQYRFDEGKDRDRMKRYTAYVKKRYKL